MVDQYTFSGSLPEEATTYVTREADGELYQGLKAGKFCYVLNSRQSGKSSLRVRTMRRLRDDGVECAAIDLSAGGIQNVPPEQWYADLIDTLIESFGLDLDFAHWWSANQLNSLVTRFRKFLEEILLAEFKENIVIFIDEIDSVLSLNFPTDDFFALIRACYNKRVDNPELLRLTFCLLGVASPSNLIEDKQRTPFNIGKAISLKGFHLLEVKPLEKGLQGKFSEPQAVMKEILYWTGGQPFLTQKLCQFMVEEFETDNARNVEQVVRSRIIENWERLDEPDHLRTIRARILRDEQRAGYLLELYQQIRQAEEQSEITANDTLEQSELQLSGLVVKQHNHLRVYNPIYKEVFDVNWIESQLNNLRPYSENFRFWVDSKGTDPSRLLRGKALQNALKWSKDKNLSYQDRQFLSASQTQKREEEVAALEKEAQFERERKDKEAAEQRNQVLAEANQTLAEANQTLTEANKKAKKRIRVGSFVLGLTLVVSVSLGGFAVVTLGRIQEQAKNLSLLSKLSGELQSKNKQQLADEARRQLGLAYGLKEYYELEQAVLLSGIAFAHQELGDKESADENIQNSVKLLQKEERESSPLEKEVYVYVFNIQGALLKEQNNNTEAIRSYKKAYSILKSKSAQLNPFNTNNKILNADTVELVHRGLINLLTDSEDKKLLSQVRESLKEHYFAELDNLLKNKKWEASDRVTSKLMLYIAEREGIKERYSRDAGYLGIVDADKFSCEDLRIIDDNWKNHSYGQFGFGVQKKIWLYTANSHKYNEKALREFFLRLRWDWDYNKIIQEVEKDYLKAPPGILPTLFILWVPQDWYPQPNRIFLPNNVSEFFSRTLFCQL